MTSDYAHQPPEFIKLLANDLRWSLLKTLTAGDHQVNELVAQLQQPMNLISYHLKKMRDDGLVTARRSEADGRDVYYSLELTRLRQMFSEAGSALHPTLGLSSRSEPLPQFSGARVLFICTHNSARSQMAEGLLRHLSKGTIEVQSAGSHSTQVHPDAIRTMDEFGIDIRSQRAKSFDAIEGKQFDYVISVCDKAREDCPDFAGAGQQLHWGFPDPVAIGDSQARLAAFGQIARSLKTRMDWFLTTLYTRAS
jgi:ArsR family transcriptional regulator, arsenate/arsenite/antimonite-responsive transcriptional repressor / arsenate reductase (thioredoxin)